jgi:two-component sensor histidine kinase
MNIVNTDTIGLRIVNYLIEQIEGTIERFNGTKFTMEFEEEIIIKFDDHVV